MASGFGKKTARWEPGLERIETVSTLSPETHAATKVIAKACSWADQRRIVRDAAADQKGRAIGRLAKSSDELAEAVEKYRKAGKVSPP